MQHAAQPISLNTLGGEGPFIAKKGDLGLSRLAADGRKSGEFHRMHADFDGAGNHIRDHAYSESNALEFDVNQLAVSQIDPVQGHVVDGDLALVGGSSIEGVAAGHSPLRTEGATPGIFLQSGKQGSGDFPSKSTETLTNGGEKYPSGDPASDTADLPVNVGKEANKSATSLNRSLLSSASFTLLPSANEQTLTQPATTETSVHLTQSMGQISGEVRDIFDPATATRTNANAAYLAQTTPGGAQAIGNQIVASIAAKGNDTKIEVRLDPPELGRVTIEFDGRGGDLVRAVVRADLHDTFDLLRRNIDILQRELEKNGLDDVSLEMGERGDGSGEKFNADSVSLFPATEEPQAPGDDRADQSLLVANGRLDQRY